MNKKKLQEQVTKNWNNIHVEFEEGCEKLGFKLPFHGASESVELADEYAEPWVSNSMWCS